MNCPHGRAPAQCVKCSLGLYQQGTDESLQVFAAIGERQTKIVEALAHCEHTRPEKWGSSARCPACGAVKYSNGSNGQRLHGIGWHVPELVEQAKALDRDTHAAFDALERPAAPGGVDSPAKNVIPIKPRT